MLPQKEAAGLSTNERVACLVFMDELWSTCHNVFFYFRKKWAVQYIISMQITQLFSSVMKMPCNTLVPLRCYASYGHMCTHHIAHRYGTANTDPWGGGMLLFLLSVSTAIKKKNCHGMRNWFQQSVSIWHQLEYLNKYLVALYWLNFNTLSIWISKLIFILPGIF